MVSFFFFNGGACALPPCLRGLVLMSQPCRPPVQVAVTVREAGPRTPTTSPTSFSQSKSGGAREGSASQPPSGDSSLSTWDYDYDYVQELIKVAPPALARLLSFEHLRYGSWQHSTEVAATIL